MSELLDRGFVIFFLVLNGTYAVLVALAFVDAVQRRARRMPEFDLEVLGDQGTPPVTLLAPAFNEELTIVSAVRSFLQLEYPALRVIVINDGSRDRTMERLVKAFALEPFELLRRGELLSRPVRACYQSRNHPNLWVIDKLNGGKADALNAGFDYARTPLVCSLDADTIVERRALLRMVEPFLYGDGEVAAVGGTVRVVNGCRVRDGLVVGVELPGSWLARFQIVEYLRAFGSGRMGFNRLGGNLIISGAFGMFRRDAVVGIGGYRTDTVGEDIDLVVRLHRARERGGPRWEVVHIPDPVSFTEVPETLAVLGGQRDRWQRGLADVLSSNLDLLFNRSFGSLGLLVVPIYFFIELLGAVVELAGYGWFLFALQTGSIEPALALLYFVVAFLLGFLISMQCMILDDLQTGFFRGVRQRAVLTVVAMLENFGFRQLLLLYRVRGMLRFLRGDKSWGRMIRRGFGPGQTHA